MLVTAVHTRNTVFNMDVFRSSSLPVHFHALLALDGVYPDICVVISVILIEIHGTVIVELNEIFNDFVVCVFPQQFPWIYLRIRWKKRAEFFRIKEPGVKLSPCMLFAHINICKNI